MISALTADTQSPEDGCGCEVGCGGQTMEGLEWRTGSKAWHDPSKTPGPSL